MSARVAVIYYSAGGHVHQLAQAVASGAESGGANVRLRRVHELAPPEAIASNPAWRAHHDAAAGGIREADVADLEWANGYAFGTPTRHGLPAAQLKQFLDQCGPLWRAGTLKDKVVTSCVSTQNAHGGQGSTILALNMTGAGLAGQTRCARSDAGHESNRTVAESLSTQYTEIRVMRVREQSQGVWETLYTNGTQGLIVTEGTVDSHAGMAYTWVKRGSVIALVALMAWLGVNVSAARSQTIPEGSALWYACTQADFSGPPALACPQPYNPLYLSTFLSGFSRFTPENEFQAVYLEPTQNHFDFTLADQIAQFAIAHHMTIRGHALLWWGEEPYWLGHPLLRWSSTQLAAVMRSYITTVVSHFASTYPGTVPEWDVVNEPLDPQGNLIRDVWEQVLGPGYIPTALEEAHATDPSADLVINDEGSGAPGPESTGMLNLATQLVNEHVPLNTVGFEAHVNPESAATLPQLLSLWQSYATLGLKVEVTELDVSDYDGIDSPLAKAAVFERYAIACRLSPNCTGYSVWGVADQYSWLGASSDALLYNSSFAPSAAVSLVQNDLNGLLAAHAPGAATARCKTAIKAKQTHKTAVTHTACLRQPR